MRLFLISVSVAAFVTFTVDAGKCGGRKSKRSSCCGERVVQYCQTHCSPCPPSTIVLPAPPPTPTHPIVVPSPAPADPKPAPVPIPRAPQPPRQTTGPSGGVTEVEVKEKKHKVVTTIRTTSADLDWLNSLRAQRGLRPYLFDEGLTQAAERCAAEKARLCRSGHINDFSFLPPGAFASAAGADGSKIHASNPNWYSCCAWDGYTYAGAATAVGPDGNRYYSLFVR